MNNIQIKVKKLKEGRVFDTCSTLNSLQTAEMRCFFVKFYHFICCTGLYLFWNYAIIRYETQL